MITAYEVQLLTTLQCASLGDTHTCALTLALHGTNTQHMLLLIRISTGVRFQRCEDHLQLPKRGLWNVRGHGQWQEDPCVSNGGAHRRQIVLHEDQAVEFRALPPVKSGISCSPRYPNLIFGPICSTTRRISSGSALLMVAHSALALFVRCIAW